MQPIVQDWVEQTYENYGFMLKAINKSTSGCDLRMYSWEYINPNKQTAPYLEISYRMEYKKAFYLKDHLGNIRVTLNDAGVVITADDYYLFGLQMPDRSYVSELDRNIYKFSSKELDEENFTRFAPFDVRAISKGYVDITAEKDNNPIDWYYFGARYYDPAIGRWLSVDPIEQDPSPYIYCVNNPIRAIDPDGLSWHWNEDKQDWDHIDDGDDNYYAPDADPIVVTAEGSDENSSDNEYNFAARAISWWFFATDDVDRVLYDAKYFRSEGLSAFMMAIIPGGQLKKCKKAYSLLKLGGKIATKKFIKKYWVKATFKNALKSAEYHFKTHGKGRTFEQYSRAATNFFKKNKNIGRIVPSRTGEPSILIRKGNTMGRYTMDGKIITYAD